MASANGSPDPCNAMDAVERAVKRTAGSLVAAVSARVIALTVKEAQDSVMPATPTAGESPLLDRLAAHQPVTPLADPEVGQDRHLGDWGQRPGTVGDVLAARDVNGQRVARTLERHCAMAAARAAPQLAHELATAHPGIEGELARAHAIAIQDAGPAMPSSILCSEVAALLTIELLSAMHDSMENVPVEPTVVRQ